MRSLTLSLILVAGVATHADAQVSGITAPINKARAAAAAIDARNKAQTDGPDAAPRRDSVPVAQAPSAAPAAQKPVAAATQSQAKPTTAKPDAPKPGTTKPAPVKPESASTPAAGTKTVAGAKPVDTTRVLTPGKPGATTPTPPSDKSGAPVPPPQAAPGKGTPAGGKAPAGANGATPGKPGAVTPGDAKPSTTVEPAPADVPPPTSVSTAAARPEIAINREVFQYDAAGRRDPFASLLLTSDLRPIFSDLLLVVINYDPQGRNSVAIMRDATTKEQYRVRQGQLIGRMRVAAIEPKRVMFTIDEFGFSRQETLVIGDTTKVRKQ